MASGLHFKFDPNQEHQIKAIDSTVEIDSNLSVSEDLQ